MSRILLVEDDIPLASSLKARLLAEQYHVDLVHNGLEAEMQVIDPLYDLVILDWQLPGTSGYELCKLIRAKGCSVNVLMLTSKDSIDEKTAGLESGADDYLCKPFSIRELLARIKALLRRGRHFQQIQYKIGNDLLVDVSSRQVTMGKEKVHLQRLEFNVLEYFLTHPRTVLSVDTLMLQVWKDETDVSKESVYTCITRLRKKLNMSDKDSPIKTVHGLGYVYDPPFPSTAT